MRKQGFKDPKKAMKYLKSKERPLNIPPNPEIFYSKDNIELKEKALQLLGIAKRKVNLNGKVKGKASIDLSKTKTKGLKDIGKGRTGIKGTRKGKAGHKKNSKSSRGLDRRNNKRRLSAGIHTVRIKMANGKTRKQKVRVYANGKRQFIKNNN